MSPRTRDALLFVKEALDTWYVSLALFWLQFASALAVHFSWSIWFAIPFYALAAVDGCRFIRRFSTK